MAFDLGFQHPGAEGLGFFLSLGVQGFVELFWVCFFLGVSGSGSRVLGCWVFGVSG